MKTKPISLLTKAACCGALLATFDSPAWAATLTNRYSFTTDASDSVGGANGALVNATIAGGEAVLANPPPIASSDVTGQYVALPANLITNYTAVTFETWVTPTHDDVTGGAFWNRIWDFGNSAGNGILPFFWFRSGNNAQGVRGDIVSTVEGDTISGPPLADGQRSHVVWTSDGVSKRGRVYVNGVLVGANDAMNVTPANMGTTTNDWLGRSQFGGDRYFNGTIAEFRIYSDEISPLDVAADFQAGPDALGGGGGTVTNLQVQVFSPLAISASTHAVLLAKASGLTNAVDIANSAVAVTWSSGNTNVLRVNSAGLVTGFGVGVTTVIGTVGSVSATQSVSVIAVPTTMTHRYSFTADANDSIGTAHGTLQGGATISGGQVLLDGVVGTWVDLPAYMIHPTNFINGAVSFESWATYYPLNGAWTRLFDFGNISGTFGANYIFFAPNNGANGGQARTAISDANPGFNGEDGFNTANVLGRTNLHIAVTYNPNPGRNFLGLYVNGSLLSSITTAKPFSSINDAYSFLGRSLYAAAGDAWLAGSIDEFRIYDGELSRFQLAASFQSGPNTTNFNVGTFQSLVLGIGPSSMPRDQLRQATCIINFSSATNINLLGDGNLTLSSSDTNIVGISSPGGVITSRGIGSATLTAVYRYIVGVTTNSYTNSTAISIFIPPAQMVHRYTFNEGAGLVVNDLVGGANGQIIAATNTLNVTNMAWIPGQLLINTNTALGAQDTYVDLGPGIVSVLASNATFEVWATDLDSAGWQRVFDFGSVPASPTNAAQPNVFLTRGPGNTTPRYDWVSGNINANAAWANNVQAHFVVTHDGTDGAAKLYRDGVLVASSAAQAEALSSINDIYGFLGRSIYSWPISLPGGFFDPYYIGAFNEFRIYRGLLTEAEIQEQFAIGPDQLIANVPLTASLSGGNIILSWPLYGAHFTLESSLKVGPGSSWAPVGGSVTQSGATYRMTTPTSGSATFFRLHRAP